MYRFMPAATFDRSPADSVIRDLATPVLEIEENMLLVPLIGTIDARRADRMTDQLLRAVGQRRARVVVVDTTGVSRIDGPGADRLLGTVHAARLLGAVVILTGIFDQVAGAIASSGATLDELTCASDLRSGIELGRRFLLKRRAQAAEPRDRALKDTRPRNGALAASGRRKAWAAHTGGPGTELRVAV